MYKRLNITLQDDVLARADAFAKRERYTRSGLIAAALEAFVAGEGAASAGEHEAISRAAEEPASYGTSTVARLRRLSLERVGPVVRAYFEGRGDVEAAWIFGSVARGTAGPMSDVDVAVLPKGTPDSTARWDLRMEASSRLSGLLGVNEVDVAVIPDVSVSVAFAALVDGTRVLGLASARAAEAEVRAVTDYWDYEPIRKALRERLGERIRSYGADR